jgi:thiol-disulfide isomerase/thioredoxin
MKKNSLKYLTKILPFVLTILLIFGILYYFIQSYDMTSSSDMLPMPPDMPPMPSDNIIESFNNLNNQYNQSKMIIIYTASWCPHCRSFMGMEDKNSPISEDSEFAKTKRELGECFEHVKDTDPNCSERMQKHGINGYPGIAFVDKNSDVGVPLSNVKRTSEDICAKFKALSS